MLRLVRAVRAGEGSLPIIAKRVASVQTAIMEPTVSTRLQALGMEPTPGRSPEALAALATTDREKWGPVTKTMGAGPD